MNKEPDIHASLQERELGGLGILMVRRMTESTEYEYRDHMNRLTLIMKQDV